MLLNLLPATKDYLWGGSKLKTDYHKSSGGSIIAETWELSCHPDGYCTVENYDNIPLIKWIDIHGTKALGSNSEKFKQFPILVKLIDASEDLSIQVHPDDSYAMEYENGYGKTEMWYVVDCEPGATLYCGFNKSVTKAEFERAIKESRLTEILNKIPVKRGDAFFIAPGTIHAIGAGIVIAEIQQSSNLTYRVFDYNRTDASGNLRELHLEQALAVTKTEEFRADANVSEHLADCEYFIVDKQTIDSIQRNYAEETSFHHILIINGNGEIACGEESLPLKCGSSILVTAGSGMYTISGNVELLLTMIP